MIVWTAGHNMPGYLPEGDVVAFETREEAVSYTVRELEEAAERAYDLSVFGPTVAYEYDEAALKLSEHDADVDGDWYDTFEGGRIAYWFQAVDMTDDEAREALNREEN